MQSTDPFVKYYSILCGRWICQGPCSLEMLGLPHTAGDWLVVFVEVVYGMKNIIFKSGGNEGDVSVFCYFLNWCHSFLLKLVLTYTLKVWSSIPPTKSNAIAVNFITLEQAISSNAYKTMRVHDCHLKTEYRFYLTLNTFKTL